MMTRILTWVCLPLALLLATENLYAQAEQRPEKLLEEDETLVEEDLSGPDESGEVETPASNVVDTSEENFRRSMELREASVQRSPDLTTGSYSRGTGLQALDDLPDESQKHLRGQLREVIVENGPWTPEDAGTEYPYVASEQAENNPSLQRREQTAWGEMVDEYHEREEAIHANAARIEAASRKAGTTGMAQTPGAGSGSQSEVGQEGDSQSGESGQPGAEQSQSQSESARAARAAALGDMLNSPGNQNSEGGGGNPPSAEPGTEQNALELLTQRQQIPANAQVPVQPAVNIEISREDSPSQRQDAGEAEDQGVVLGTEGVIAIEDLDKVRVDPNESDN